MKPKTMILMGLAVACGLGASFMTSRLLAERQPDEAKEQVRILVAKKNLDMGLMIKNTTDMFEEKSFGKGDEPKNAIVVPDNQFASVVDQLKGRQLKIARRAGDFISMEDLHDSASMGLGGNLPEGHRAVGIRVNMEAIAGGFAALPHSRVDIIWTVRRGGDRETFSKILLENVLVLAADTTSQRDGDGRAMPASVVTVAVTPEQMLKVNAARETGSLSLALRKLGDTKQTNLGKVTVEQTMSGHASSNVPEDDDDPTGRPGLAGSFGNPRGKAGVQAQVALKRDLQTHRLSVFEGDRERHTDYSLDENGKVVQPEIIRSEIEPTPAPAATPRTTAPTTPGIAAPSKGGN